MKGTGVPIHEGIQFSTLVFAHPAITPFTPGDMALFWAEFALDRFFIKMGEPGRKLCLDETFFHYLRMGRPGKTEYTGKRKYAGARSAKLEKLPSR